MIPRESLVEITPACFAAHERMPARQQPDTRKLRGSAVPGRASPRTWIAILAVLGASPHHALGQAPEYMRIDPRPGLTLEVSGAMSDDGVFVAHDVEVLPQVRRPQLRGRLTAVDSERRVLVMYGLRLHLSNDTETDDAGSAGTALGEFRPGQRVEASCAIDGSGTWTVKHVQTVAVKASDKIKGTITRAAVDGVAPDTLEISGLRILLVTTTDVNVADPPKSRRERALFPDLARPDRNHPMVTLAGKKLQFLGEYRGNARSRSDFDLSRNFDSDASEGLSELRLGLAGYWSGPLSTFGEARLRALASVDDMGTLAQERVEAHVTQLYVLVRAPGTRGIALQLGRQDFDEPREWIFDEYLDAARLVLYGAGPVVLEGAFIRPFHPINPAFETWTDAFAMARWYFDSRSHAAAWLLARSDRDPVRNRQPVWIGARYWGRVRGGLQPWLDAAWMRGEDKHRTLRAWAVDAGATWLGAELPGMPSVTGGYAVGSGDESTSDGIDGNFRQTGYEDNWARFGGVVARKIYGSLLDPELSNVDVLTLGAGARPVRDASLEVFWHRYRQRAARDELQGSNLVDPPARPNGASRELGWTIEFVAAAPPLWGKLRAAWTLALFRPGLAFSPRHEDAFWQRLELTAQF